MSIRAEPAVRIAGYGDLDLYYGDLHTHCNVGIAYGTAEEGFQNARTQLDFSTVTAQTSWMRRRPGSTSRSRRCWRSAGGSTAPM